MREYEVRGSSRISSGNGADKNLHLVFSGPFLDKDGIPFQVFHGARSTESLKKGIASIWR